MEKDLINDTVSYAGLNSLADVLESCMEKYSTYNAITDKYNNIYMTYGELRQEMLDFAQETAMKAGLRSEYILADITKQKFPKRYDFVENSTLFIIHFHRHRYFHYCRKAHSTHVHGYSSRLFLKV